MTRLGLAVAALCGCGGATGTFSLELVTAPGSTVLDGVTRARLTLSDPLTVVEATRGPDGRFDLAMEVPAQGGAPSFVSFEGLDASGAVIAWGRSAALPIAAVDSSVAIYVAAPESIAAAAVTLDPPRSELGVARFGFGVLLVGGAGAGGTPLDDVEIYDVYAHAFIPGDETPAPRAAASVGAGVTGYGYVFGGRGPGGDTGTFWRFDTTVQPEGAWQEFADLPELARSGAAIAPFRADAFVITGDPPLVLDGFSIALGELAEAPALAGTATSVQREDVVRTVFAGAGSGGGGLVTLGPEGFEEHVVPAAARTEHGAVSRLDATVLIVGGAIEGVPAANGVLANPTSDEYTEVIDLLATPRTAAAIGGNGAVAIVAGGLDAGGALLGDAEVIDLVTLERRAVLPMLVPRRDAAAVPLTTGQILILGGVDAAGEPVGVIEVFNPPAPGGA